MDLEHLAPVNTLKYLEYMRQFTKMLHVATIYSVVKDKKNDIPWFVQSYYNKKLKMIFGQIAVVL